MVSGQYPPDTVKYSLSRGAPRVGGRGLDRRRRALVETASSTAAYREVPARRSA